MLQYELGLPIAVKKGIIGKVSLNIPWNRLCSQTSVVFLEVSDLFLTLSLFDFFGRKKPII